MKRLEINSLGFRVAFLSTIGTIVVTVITAVVISSLFRNTQTEGLELKGRSMAELISQIVVPFIDFEDDAAAAEVLAGPPHAGAVASVVSALCRLPHQRDDQRPQPRSLLLVAGASANPPPRP